MTRICFLAISTELGGAERSLSELLEQMQKFSTKYKPFVIVPNSSGPLVEHLQSLGIEWVEVSMPKSIMQISRGAIIKSFFQSTVACLQIPGYVFRLSSMIRAKKPALIHTTGLKCHLLGAVLGHHLKIPVLWHIRDIFSSKITNMILSSFSSQVHIIYNSKASKEALSISRKNKFDDVLYNGLSPEIYFKHSSTQISKQLELQNKTPIVGIVGVLAKWKGQLEFIQMAHELIKMGRDVQFVIIGDQIYDTSGDSGYKQELIQAIRSYQLEKRVHLLGFKKDTAKWISELTLLVHASTKPEPFGRVALEAMACEVPVMASRAGGILEFVDHENTGMTFEMGNVKEMTFTATRLLDSFDLRQKLITQSKDFFIKNFTLKKHFEKFENICEIIIKNS